MEIRRDIVVLIFASLMVFGTFLQFVSYIAPGWTVFKYTNQYGASWYYFHEKLLQNHTYNWGMWYYRICNASDACVTKSYHDEYHSYISENKKDEKTGIKWTHGNMYEYMVMEQMRTVCSFACSVASCVAVVLFLKLQRWTMTFAFLTVILTTVSESLAFQLIVEYGHNERWSSTFPRDKYQHQHSIPYSILLNALGLVLRLAGSIYCTIHVSKTLL